MEYVIKTSGAFLLLVLVSSVSGQCPKNLPCERAGESCREVQDYVNCIKKEGRLCPREEKDKHQSAIHVIIRIYSKPPFNCEITSGSSSLHIGVGALLAMTALQVLLNLRQ